MEKQKIIPQVTPQASIFDVAKYILHKQGKTSSLKLQKLCYYAQAWTLAWEEAPLFGEKIEAWANGPTSPALASELEDNFSITEVNLQKGDISNLSNNALENIDIIIRDYGDKDAYYLKEQAVNELPWLNARCNASKHDICNPEITIESMRFFYGTLLKTEKK